jgi:hypothetical protein
MILNFELTEILTGRKYKIPICSHRQRKLTLLQRIARLELLAEVLIKESNAKTSDPCKPFSDSLTVKHIQPLPLQNSCRLPSSQQLALPQAVTDCTAYEFGSLTYWDDRMNKTSVGWMPQFLPSGTQLVATHKEQNVELHSYTQPTNWPIGDGAFYTMKEASILVIENFSSIPFGTHDSSNNPSWMDPRLLRS